MPVRSNRWLGNSTTQAPHAKLYTAAARKNHAGQIGCLSEFIEQHFVFLSISWLAGNTLRLIILIISNEAQSNFGLRKHWINLLDTIVPAKNYFRSSVRLFFLFSAWVVCSMAGRAQNLDLSQFKREHLITHGFGGDTGDVTIYVSFPNCLVGRDTVQFAFVSFHEKDSHSKETEC